VGAGGGAGGGGGGGSCGLYVLYMSTYLGACRGKGGRGELNRFFF